MRAHALAEECEDTPAWGDTGAYVFEEDQFHAGRPEGPKV